MNYNNRGHNNKGQTTINRGVLVDCEGSGAHARVQVNFEQAGCKWLVLAYAKLSVL